MRDMDIYFRAPNDVPGISPLHTHSDEIFNENRINVDVLYLAKSFE